MFIRMLTSSGGIDFYLLFIIFSSGENTNYLDSFNFRQYRFLDNILIFQNIDIFQFISLVFFFVKKYE